MKSFRPIKFIRIIYIFVEEINFACMRHVIYDHFSISFFFSLSLFWCLELFFLLFILLHQVNDCYQGVFFVNLQHAKCMNSHWANIVEDFGSRINGQFMQATEKQKKKILVHLQNSNSQRMYYGQVAEREKRMRIKFNTALYGVAFEEQSKRTTYQDLHTTRLNEYHGLDGINVHHKKIKSALK